jgi:plastocyanin
VPNIVTAAVGDVVQFQFSNGNHTVTQSAQDAACQPLQATVATAIHSGRQYLLRSLFTSPCLFMGLEMCS